MNRVSYCSEGVAGLLIVFTRWPMNKEEIYLYVYLWCTKDCTYTITVQPPPAGPRLAPWPASQAPRPGPRLAPRLDRSFFRHMPYKMLKCHHFWWFFFILALKWPPCQKVKNWATLNLINFALFSHEINLFVLQLCIRVGTCPLHCISSITGYIIYIDIYICMVYNNG